MLHSGVLRSAAATRKHGVSTSPVAGAGVTGRVVLTAVLAAAVLGACGSLPERITRLVEPTPATEEPIPTPMPPRLPTGNTRASPPELDVAELVAAVSAYGVQFGAAYGGAFIDESTAVVRFTDDIDEHQAALEDMFDTRSRIRVELAQYGLGTLARSAASVERQAGWFPQVAAILYSAEADVLSNRVRVRYQARDSSMEPAIRAHFGDPDWMQLKFYGRLPWDGPTGDLVIRIIDPTGTPIAASCNPEAVKPGIFDTLPQDTDAQGICAFRGVPATSYLVRVTHEADGGRELKGEYVIAVEEGGSGTATFVLDP